MFFPMPAKIKPTSPRGIMPIPTAQRFMEGGHPKPLTSFPRIATTVSAMPEIRTSRLPSDSSFTWIPIHTKKSGTTSDSTGEKNCRHKRNAANFEYADFSGNGETANDSENDQAENIINDCSAKNYFGFIAIFLVQVAQNTRCDANTGSSKNAADKKITRERGT